MNFQTKFAYSISTVYIASPSHFTCVKKYISPGNHSSFLNDHYFELFQQLSINSPWNNQFKNIIVNIFSFLH